MCDMQSVPPQLPDDNVCDDAACSHPQVVCSFWKLLTQRQHHQQYNNAPHRLQTRCFIQCLVNCTEAMLGS